MGASLSPSPEAEVSIGTVLDGRYRIEAILGTGGMGRVYRGQHTGIGRPVAIKVLHADLNRNREAAQRFQREAIASGRLDHPNIVGVSDFGIVDDGPCYLVMEVLEGESLGDRLTRDKRIPWREAIQILRGVLQGLGHAHDRGVVHRDIKPDNVFLARKDGEVVVKILDFGIAKLYAGSPDDPASTRAGLTVGTPAYLSPEQAVGGEIKPASDLYSATILLFEMLAGRPPFEETDPLAMLGAHVSRPPPRVAELAPDVEIPAALEDVIQRGLAKTSTERTASAKEYLALLDGVLAAEAGSGPVLSFLGQPLAGDAVVPTPVPGLTPLPTPAPGTLSPMVAAAPATGYHTPVPGAVGAPPGVAQTALLPASTRPVSLAEAPPLPRAWIKYGLIGIAAILAIAIIIALASGSSRDAKPKPSTPFRNSGDAPTNVVPSDPKVPAPPPTKPAPAAAAAPAPIKVPDVPLVPSVPPAIDDDTELKAALHDLEHGKTCKDRKAAIPRLLELGDPGAIPALKRARYRMRGGVLGVGASNTNRCLTKAATAAIKQLEKKKQKG